MGVSESLKRGSVELLILELLKKEDMYGYQLSQEIKERSGGYYTIQESSMYPTLYRMLEKGYISDHKKIVGKRRARVYYHIEDAGLEAYEKAKMSYLTLVNGVLKILDVKTMEELNKTARDCMIAIKQRKAAQLLEEMDLEDWDI